jgi:hypothetical protein
MRIFEITIRKERIVAAANYGGSTMGKDGQVGLMQGVG